MEKPRISLSTILLIVLCVVAILSFMRIGDLEDQIRRLENHINNMDVSLRNDMSKLVSNVEHVLEQEASIVSDAQYEVGELNVETLTIPVKVSVTPKHQQEGTTVALQLADGKIIELIRSGAVYTATLDMGIEEELERPQAIITTNGLQSVQVLEWYLEPMDYVKLYAEIHTPRIQVNPTYKIEDSIDVYVDGSGADSVWKMELVTVLDGVEQRRDLFELAERAEYSTMGTLLPRDFEWDVDKGSKLMLFVDVYAGDLVWRYAMAGVTRDESGNLTNMDLWRNEPIEVRSADGEVIRFAWAEELEY